MKGRTLIVGSVLVFVVFLSGAVSAQSPGVPPAASNQPETPVEFVCPMDPDVHSSQPGRCPRCGMALVAGIPNPVEYPVGIKLDPPRLRAGRKVQLAFVVSDPKTGKQVTDFQVVHEKLYHMFLVSQDLRYFLHDHPTKGPDGVFRFDAVLPKPGMYRILSDFYPQGGTPQLIVRTIVVPGAAVAPGAELQADLAQKQSGNMEVSLAMEPRQPIAGMKTLMFFHLNSTEGLEPYLGAWAHMLAASDDLVDMIHTHPFIADGGPQVQFDLIFPRARVYRVWVQFQRKGVINTAVFNVPVSELK